MFQYLSLYHVKSLVYMQKIYINPYKGKCSKTIYVTQNWQNRYSIKARSSKYLDELISNRKKICYELICHEIFL